MDTKIVEGKIKEECYICGKFCAPSMIKSHVRSHTNLTIHECDECGRRLSTRKILKQHKKLHNLYFRCHDCNRKYKDESEFKNHSCTTEKKKDRLCETCGKAFFTLHDLTRHIRTHTEEKPYVCDICNKGFTQKSNRDKHYLIHNKDESSEPPIRERKYVCDICFQAFTYKQHLNRHHIIHTGERPYVCGVCNKGFTQSTHLKLHADIHSNEKKYKCEKCDKIYRQKYSLTEHKKTHGEQKFFCSVCKKGFFSKTKLENHFFTHSNVKPYICDVCHKSFTTSTYLERHYLRHAHETSKRKNCRKPINDCLSEDSLDEMADSNSSSCQLEKKPSTCEVCQSCFPDESALLCHNEEFLNGGKFQCCMCKQIYSAKESLIIHHKVHVSLPK